MCKNNALFGSNLDLNNALFGSNISGKTHCLVENRRQQDGGRGRDRSPLNTMKRQDKQNKKKDRSNAAYVPKDYEVVDKIDKQKFSDEDIELAKKQVEAQNKRVKGLSVLNVVWTFLSTVYAIASTCVLISRRWVESRISYVLIGILVLYVGIFIGVAIAAFSSPKDGNKSLKGLKHALKFLKPIMSIVLIALAIAEVIAIAEEAFSIPKILFMIVTMLVAFLQLVLRATLLVAKMQAKKVAKGFEVRMERYVDGKKKKKSLGTKLKEKRYSD